MICIFCRELALETSAKYSSIKPLEVHDLCLTHSLASLQWSGLYNQWTFLPTESCLQCQKWRQWKRFLCSLVPGPSYPSKFFFWLLAVWKNGGLVHLSCERRCVYLVQRGGGVPNQKNELEALPCTCSLCPKRWSFSEVKKTLLLIQNIECMHNRGPYLYR